MLKQLIIPTYLFFFHQATAQILLKNMVLTRPDSNVLLLDWENRLMVLPGNAQNVTLVSQNGWSINKNGYNEFIIVPKSMKPDIIKVFINKKIVANKNYTIDTIAMYSVHLGNLIKDTASVTEVLANKGLRCTNDNKIFAYPYSIVSFSTITIDNRGDTLTRRTPTDGNMLSMEQQSNIKKLTKNSWLIFDYIIISGPGMKNRRANPLRIVIR